MSCTPIPTETKYATVTTFTPSTSYSQSTNQPQASTVVQQTCVASGTISGSSIGCVSSAPVTEVTTVGGGQAAQVPIVVSVPVTEAQPTQTLFAPCTNGGATSPAAQTSTQSSNNTPPTTSILVQTTPPPSILVEPSSTTLPNGSVVQTVVTTVTTLPPTSFYVPTSPPSPALQSSSSQGSGTHVAPIVGGVLGGFFGLIVIVGSLWWLCRRRRSWDDIFEEEIVENEEAWTPPAPARRERDRRKVDSNAEPKPYQYGLVGHVVAPAAAGEPLRTSQYGSVSEHSGTHSRSTSHSAVPLLQNVHTGSRPSTAGSLLTGQAQPGSRVLSPAPRSLSMVSQSSSTRPLLDTTWIPNMDELAILEPLNRTGSPVPATERRILQIVNDEPPSPTDTVTPGGHRTSSEPPPRVSVHTGGRENSST